MHYFHPCPPLTPWNLTGDAGSYHMLEAVGKAQRNAQSGE